MGHPRDHEHGLRVRHKRCKQWTSCEIGTAMLWTILTVLLVLWLIGLVTSHTFGGLIHILLVVALIVFLVNLFQGRRRAV